MKNRKIAIFFDAILTLFICFFVGLLALSSLKRAPAIKFILSLIFALAISAIVFIHKRNKYNSLMLTKKQIKELESLMLSLELMADNEVEKLLIELLKAYEIDAQPFEGGLKFNNTVYLFNFSKQLTREGLCNKLKGINEKVIFFCNTLNADAEELLACIKDKVKIINGETLFKLMNNVEFNKSALILAEQKTKPSLKGITEKAFTKKRAVRYAVISATLLLFSRFTFFPGYYKICSATLLLLSAICLIFGKKEQKTNLPELAFKQS